MSPSQLFPWGFQSAPQSRTPSAPPQNAERPFLLFTGLRSRSAAAVSIAGSTSTSRTAASRSTLAPRVLTKEPGLTQPTITLTHAEPVISPIERPVRRTPQRANSASTLGRSGKEDNREQEQPVRSLSEEALVKQMESEGRGQRMSLMLRSRTKGGLGGQDTPQSPSEPTTPATPTELIMPVVETTTTSTSVPPESFASQPEPIPPAATSTPDPPQPEGAASSIRKLGSWMGSSKLNLSRPSSIKASTPIPTPTALNLPEPDDPPGKAEPTLLVGSMDSGPMLPGGLSMITGASSVGGEDARVGNRDNNATGSVANQVAPPAPAGWWGYLGYSSLGRTDGKKTVEKVVASEPPAESLQPTIEPSISDESTAIIVQPAPPVPPPTNDPSPPPIAPTPAAAVETPPDVEQTTLPPVTDTTGSANPGWTGYLTAWVPQIAARPSSGNSTPSATPNPASNSPTLPSEPSTQSLATVESSPVIPQASAIPLPQVPLASTSKTAWLFGVAAKAAQTRQSTSSGASTPLQIASATPETAGEPSMPPLASGTAAPPSPHILSATPAIARISTPAPSPSKSIMGPPNTPSGISQSFSANGPIVAAKPNLVLPTFDHMFKRPPRSLPPLGSVPDLLPITAPPINRPLAWLTLGAIGSMGQVDKTKGESPTTPAPAVEKEETRGKGAARGLGGNLPRVEKDGIESWAGIRRVVVVGVHGWFPNKNVQIVTGVPRSSAYFASMMGQAVLAQFEADHGVAEQQLEKMTYIPLDGEGTIDVRVDKLFKQYLSHPEWISDLRRADAVFFAAHSQGCIVTAHLIYRLIAQGHLRTPLNAEAVARCEWAFGPIVLPDHAKNGTRRPGLLSRGSSDEPDSKPQRISLLGMCGVHLGPFFSINSSTVLQPYLWFENAAAKELFDFQDSASPVSASYHRSLASILDNGVKTVFLSSLDDQMVPIYSASFSSASHPLILRALYVDASSYSASDFMANLLIFCLMLKNAGLDDQGLVGHLSEVTAGGLTGVGHSAPYEDLGGYTLLVRYTLQTSSPAITSGQLEIEPFTARDAKNDFELPWILRGVMDDPMVKDLFGEELKDLKKGILEWRPNTKALKEIKKRLEPMAGKVALRNQRLVRTPSSASLVPSEGKKDGPERTTPTGSLATEGLRRPSNAA